MIAGHRWLRGLALLLAVASLALGARAGIEVDAERELRLIGEGVTPPKRFGEVAFRLAVFSYEDPDGLGLGDALAALASHELLAEATVSSIGVLRYSGRLTPTAGDERGYFDKVELLARPQEPTLALWGMVRREGEGATVETFLQLPRATRVPALQARLRLPQAMGGAELRATAGSDRILLQRLQLDGRALAGLREAAGRLGQLRSEPRAGAPATTTVPMGSVYYIVARRGDWVQMAVSRGGRGWVPVSGHCTGGCAALLAGPRFVSQMLAFMARREAPTGGDSLAPDARQFLAELQAMATLKLAAPMAGYDTAVELLSGWQPGKDTSAAEGPALGATAANLLLMARLANGLWQAQTAGGYQQAALPKEAVRAAVYDAAEALLIDPRNADLLHNLQVLYRWLGDDERAALAGRLLEQSAQASRRRW